MHFQLIVHTKLTGFVLQGYPMAYMPQQVDFQHASPGLDKYQCLVQKNGKMSHPGLVTAFLLPFDCLLTVDGLVGTPSALPVNSRLVLAWSQWLRRWQNPCRQL